MCIMEAAAITGAVRSTRDNVHSLTGMGSSETRGSGASPTVNVYSNQPGGDVSKNTDDLKMPTQGSSKGGGGSGY